MAKLTGYILSIIGIVILALGLGFLKVESAFLEVLKPLYIMIIGIDDNSLNTIGKWPFKRSVHSKIVDYFSNSEYRESLLFFDIFFLEDDYDPQQDKMLI